MKNLSTFARLGSRCALGISFIVGKDNAEHIADFCRQAKEAGISSVKFSGCVVSNSGKENNEYHAVITGTVRAQLDAAGKLADKDFKIIDHYHALEERFDKVYTRCAYLQFLTVIGADCVVYTCQDKAYTDSGTPRLHQGSLLQRLLVLQREQGPDEGPRSLPGLHPSLRLPLQEPPPRGISRAGPRPRRLRLTFPVRVAGLGRKTI